MEKDGLHKHLYAYHPNLVQPKMVVRGKYIANKAEEQVEVRRQIQSESEIGLLKHVETNEAVELNNKCEKERNKGGCQPNRERKS